MTTTYFSGGALQSHLGDLRVVGLQLIEPFHGDLPLELPDNSFELLGVLYNVTFLPRRFSTHERGTDAASYWPTVWGRKDNLQLAHSEMTQKRKIITMLQAVKLNSDVT